MNYIDIKERGKIFIIIIREDKIIGNNFEMSYLYLCDI